MIFGADFTTLEEVEQKGGVFRADGKAVDLVECLAENGITSARLRLWMNPFDNNGNDYGGGICDFERVRRMAERAKHAGMDFMLDLHYSDFWCDPGRQMIPKAWQGMDLKTMSAALYEYTARTLDAFGKAGLMPESTQVGNEITNGMLWPLAQLGEGSPRQGYDALAEFLRAGTKAVRESSDSSVMLHLERSGDIPLWQEWLDNIFSRGVSCDELGASYYPYWHGSFEALRENMDRVAERYGKNIRIVETSYAFTGDHYNPAGNFISLAMTDGDRCCDGSPMPYPASPEGQVAYFRKLVETAKQVRDGRLTGIYWWEPGWLPVDGAGWATEASLRYCHEEDKKTQNEWANQCVFDYAGNALPVLKEFHE